MPRPDTHSRQTQPFCCLARPSHWGRPFILLLCGLIFASSAAFAEESEPDLSFPEVADEPVAPTGSSTKKGSNNALIRPKAKDPVGPGIDGRIGFIGLPTLGRDDSIVPVELFPYIMTDDAIVFGDFRGFLATNGKVGGNFGLGYRVIEPNEVAMFGVNAFYDADQTTDKLFQQLSIGWEARTKMFGHYGNVYMPVGQTDRVISQSILNPRFDDHQILFDVRSRTGQAMTGLDLNLQTYFPGDFCQDHQIQATAGWYSFSGSNVENINGVQAQLQGNITPSLSLLASVTNDNTFGTNIAIGGFFRFGTREAPTIDLKGQLRRFVNRNYNVIVSQKNVLENGVVATKSNGQAYYVDHVGPAGSGTPDGTTANPFETSTDINNSNADIIYVQDGTTLNQSIVLKDGQSLFGEGANVQIADSRYGNFNLPGGSSTVSPTRPIILGSLGDAITMGNNTRVAGFYIKDAGGRGIVADGVDNFQISDVIIDTPTGDGVFVDSATSGSISNVTIVNGQANGIKLVDIDDQITLSNIYINNVAGDGVHIDGGLGNMYFTDDLIVQDAAHAAFYITNLQTLTEVDDQGTTSIADDVTTKTPGIVAVDRLVVRNTTGGKGIMAENNEGAIGFGAVDIESNGGTAFYAHDTESVVVQNGYMTSKNAPVADTNNSGINVQLTQVNADGGTDGMKFVDTTGQFVVYGTGDLSSGGTIKNTTNAVNMQNGPAVAFQTVDFTNNGTVALVDGGDSLIIVGSNITGTSNMVVNATNLTMLQIYNSQFVNNTLSSGTGILFQADEQGAYTASITETTIDSMPGTFFKAQTLAGGEGSSLASNFSSNDVTLGNIGGVAAAINWTGPVTAYFQNNAVKGTKSGQTGFQFLTGASTSQSNTLISGNSIVLAGDSSIGVDMDVSSTSTLLVQSNTITFNGLNGTGVRTNMRVASGANVSDNTIVDNSGGATGILFTNAEHLSTIVLNNNSIDLTHSSTFNDRGIILSAVSNTAGVDNPFVSFISTQSNTILGATTTYSLPVTGARGTLLINNVSVQ